jgi:hypothetical protein
MSKVRNLNVAAAVVLGMGAAQPVSAATLITGISPAVGLALNFVLSASSNTSAGVDVTATSQSQGTVTEHDTDTGFVYAEAKITAKSGIPVDPPGFATQYGRAYAEWFLRKDNVIIIEEPPPVLVAPDGLFGTVKSVASIKGILQVLVETVTGPFSTGFTTGSLTDNVFDVTVPIRLDFLLIPNVSNSFSVDVAFDGGEILNIARGGSGLDGNWLETPYLDSIDPLLADQVHDHYISTLNAGKGGGVSFYLGQGILPTGADGLPGTPIAGVLGRTFSIDSQLEGTNFGAIPEPDTWLLMLTGFGAAGLAMRRRAALANKAITRACAS